MPITITPAGPINAIGPGLGVTLQSDFIGPLPLGTNWELQLYADADATKPIWLVTIPANVPITTFRIMDMTLNPGSIGIYTITTGQLTTAHMSLVEPGVGAIDTGTGQVPWDATSGLGSQIQTLPTASASGGFTAADRTQLNAVALSTVQDHLLDTLTLQALTQGPSGGVVAAQLPTATWGILVRLANVPPGLVPITPDMDYWVKTLASVRIFRGSDIWLRIPIHRSSQIINLANEGIAVAVTNLTATTWLLNMSVQVAFLEGVTGEVFSMHLPI